MDLDSLLETVTDELEFPVTDRDLLERFGDAEVELEESGAAGTPRPLREYVEPGDPPRESEPETASPDGTRPHEFESETELRSYLQSFRD